MTASERLTLARLRVLLEALRADVEAAEYRVGEDDDDHRRRVDDLVGRLAQLAVRASVDLRARI